MKPKFIILPKLVSNRNSAYSNGALSGQSIEFVSIFLTSFKLFKVSPHHKCGIGNKMKEINLMPQTDFLITAARNGDSIALNQLVKQWYKRIYNFAFKYFGDHDQAMDVCQKTFISMNKNLGSLKEDARFKPWLYRIASNYCHEEARRQKNKWIFPFMKIESKNDRSFIDSTQTTNRTDDPEKELGNSELKALLKKALSQLPEEQRMVVIMKEYEGLKIREIAEAMDISENTVKSRLYYALGSLKKLLELWNINKETIHYEL